MKDTFLAPKTNGESLYKEKGSKFYGFCLNVQNVEEAKEKIKNIAKDFYDSRHVCFAYRIDPQNPKERANDDGEPANTAGTPILNQIYSSEAFNILVVVVRYFGGTKLGVPGLIRSYKQAAKEAIEALMDMQIASHALPETVEISKKLTPEEEPKVQERNNPHKQPQQEERGASFHEKSEKNSKVNTGGSYRRKIKVKYKKPKTKGDKNYNKRNKKRR